MKKNKRVLSALICTVILATAVVFPVRASEEYPDANITVKLRSETVVFEDAKPIIKNDRTLAPIRSVFEKLGAEVSWIDETKTAVVAKGEIKTEIQIGNSYFLKNGEQISLDVPAEIISERTYLPLRAIAEALDCDVTWTSSIRTAFIYDLDIENKQDAALEKYMQEGVYAILEHIESDYGVILLAGLGSPHGFMPQITLIDKDGESYNLSTELQKKFDSTKPVPQNLKLSDDGKTLTYSLHFDEPGTFKVTYESTGKEETVTLYEAGSYYFTADLVNKTNELSEYVPVK